MAIPEKMKPPFQNLVNVARGKYNNAELALLEARERRTGQVVTLVCVVSQHEGEYRLAPVAKMLSPDTVLDDFDPPDSSDPTGFVKGGDECRI